MAETNTTQPLQTVTMRIQRFNPDVDKKTHMQDFKVEVPAGITLLETLEFIKNKMDGTLTYQKSCRHAICGSCAMNVNGKNMLVCKVPLRDVVVNGKVEVRPLQYVPIIKDLVVDRTSFWEQYERAKPWLVPPEQMPEKEFRVSPEEVHALHEAQSCIMCGACYTACTVVAFNKKYYGPAAMLKAYMRVMDPRDTIPGERLKEVGSEDGVFKCHTIFNCIDACPKGLNPTQAIETLRKVAQRRAAFEAERAERLKTIAEPIKK